MTAANGMSTDRDPSEPSEHVSRLVHQLLEISGGSVCAILLYGSHLHRTNPDRHSAVDFVVVVDGYEPYYSALASAGELHRPISLMTALSRRLPPNVLAFAPDDGKAGVAKYLLISRADFERALGPTPRDHFLLARLVQRVAVVWTRGGEEAEWVEAQLATAYGGVLEWVAPYLDEPVDAESLGRRIIEVCYAGELRPESAGRAGRVFEAQAEHFRTVLASTLDAAVADGTMRRVGDRYALVRPVDEKQRRRVRRYFQWSKARTTARWLKHTVTFVNWLPYIVKKVERHSGRSIELTTLERRLPLVFLWPRVIHVLLTRPRREIES